MVQVDVFHNDIERALRRLKKKMAIEGVYREMRSRRYYEKPSTKRRRRKAESKKRLQKVMSQDFEPTV